MSENQFCLNSFPWGEDVKTDREKGEREGRTRDTEAKREREREGETM